MSDIEVIIYRGGIEIDRVTRPLRSVDGVPAVTYRRALRRVVNGSEIHLDGDAADAGEPLPITAGSADAETTHEPADLPATAGGWDSLQQAVIEAASHLRLQVEAGPGTGKTAVACARVAELIDRYDIEPGKIWVISFTRTAVREIRDRIAGYLNDPGAVFSVKIATLDSHAWSLHSGFDEHAKINSYEQNIESLLALLQDRESLKEYVGAVEHLIVDEAQDVVGIRADLVRELITRLGPGCGVTVFADEAQAIYGFSDDEEQRHAGQRNATLPEKLRADSALTFEPRQLTAVHRTSSPQLLRIFTETRRRVLDASLSPDQKLTSTREEVSALAHGTVPAIERQTFQDGESLFVLFRRRADVLMASAFLSDAPHRIRMSGTPLCIAPWVAAALSTHTSPDLDSETFNQLWHAHVKPFNLSQIPVDEAWAILIRLAGRTRSVVDMRRLRQQLGRRQPSADICSAELGSRGPILGTIHASKGREADVVHLMLPRVASEQADPEEEARVLFVAATRGRKRLCIGQGYERGASRIEPSGRIYRFLTRNGDPKVQLEIGRDGDIGAEGLTGRTLFADAPAATAAQAQLRSFGAQIARVTATADVARDFRYGLAVEGGPPFAFLQKAVNDDLFRIGEQMQQWYGGSRRRPPGRIPHLRVVALRSVVLPPEAPEAERLHAPWNSSGIMLAPVVLGFTTVFLPYYN